MTKKLNVKTIAYLGLGIALYAVLGMSIKIPIVNHISTDLGYVAFGVFLTLFGPAATIIGAIGCVITSMLVSGWFPTGWFLGQIVIGIICGFVLHSNTSKWIKAIVIILSVWLGVGLIKTVVECALYSLPFVAKIITNSIAAAADIIPMIIGWYLAETRFKKIV